MRYSEAKAIVRELHANGWRKQKGESDYRKIWQKRDLRVSRLLSFEALVLSNIPVARMIQLFNQEVEEGFQRRDKADRLMQEIFTQRNRLIAENYGIRDSLSVYLGSDELSLLMHEHRESIQGYERERTHWKLMGMNLFEVMTDEPHVKVTM